MSPSAYPEKDTLQLNSQSWFISPSACIGSGVGVPTRAGEDVSSHHVTLADYFAGAASD